MGASLMELLRERETYAHIKEYTEFQTQATDMLIELRSSLEQIESLFNAARVKFGFKIPLK
jgi:hypothetical protein